MPFISVSEFGFFDDGGVVKAGWGGL